MVDKIPIPQPPPHWLLGNVPDIDTSQLMLSFRRLAKLYGPIYRADIAGNRFVRIGSQELVHEVCDDERFEKKVSGPLWQVRHITGTGLFTSDTEEPDWKLAHKLLMPVFGPLAVQKMFPQMLDITGQMLMKWQRLGDKELIDPVDAFTKLTLDTIALCAFDYRFNSFYQESMHPFVTSVLDALLESGRRAGRTAIETRARIWSQQKYDEHIQYCWKICDDIVAERRAHPRDVNDLLNVMLTAKDPDTGEMMRDELIRYEMMTFLLAGHDTTSGLLNFAFLSMLQNPRTLQAAQGEVDSVLGDGPIEPRMLQKLPYIEAILRETLRLYPTAPAFTRRPKSKEDIFLAGGKYRIQPGDLLGVDLASLHRDPKVWGNDAEEFRPERMLNGAWEKLPPDAWKPFGVSFRMCIGRSLAWQEAWMAIALILQLFQPELAEPEYELKIRQTLTIKPIGWHMRMRTRPGKTLYTGLVSTSGAKEASRPTEINGSRATISVSGDFKPLTVFYGSNQGTCKTFAEAIQCSAATHGFRVSVGTLDSATENIPTDRPVVFIAPSYEGQPPDNGRRFVAWLEAHATDSNMLKGVKYAVMGVGNSDWVTTFHRIPKLIDTNMVGMGATRVVPTVLGDVAKDIYGAFDQFTDSLWTALRKTSVTEPAQNPEKLEVEITLDRPELLGEKDITLGTVRQHVQLADTCCGPEKRLMEVELADHTSYQCGDYLVVLPMNRSDDVRRVLNRFGIATDAMIKVSNTQKAFLPNDRTEYAYSLIAAYLELGTPISRKQLQQLAAVTGNEKDKGELERLTQATAFDKEILAKRASIIDVLERFPACQLDFAAYVDMLQPMKPRQYSIASSPLASAHGLASILYDVVKAPALYNPERCFHGVGSSYLADIPVGGRVHCYVRSTNAGFRLPLDHKTPVIMICAGTGLAPMRGFIQERAAIAEAQNITFGKALLYFGCRDPEKDYICRTELEAWEKKGVVELRPVFSQSSSSSGGFKHVPDRIWAERGEMVALFRAGAKIFLCGSASKLAKSTNQVLERIAMEAKGFNAEAAAQWLQEQKADRYVTDIFG